MAKIISSSLRLIACICASAILLLAGCHHEHEFDYSMASDQPLTEQLAVEFAGNALRDAGIDVATAEPVSYRPASTGMKEPYFARQDDNPNRGYVLWKTAQTKRDWDYQVYVTREGDRVVCKVLKGH